MLVFRLVTLNTVEEVIMARAAAKRKLEAVILGTGDYKSKDKDRLNKEDERGIMLEVQQRLKDLNRALVYDSASTCEIDSFLIPTPLLSKRPKTSFTFSTTRAPPVTIHYREPFTVVTKFKFDELGRIL